MSLRFRINLVISLVIVTFCLGIGAILIKDQKNSIREEIEAGTKITAQILETSVSSAVTNNQIGQQGAALSNLLTQMGRVRANEIRFYNLSDELIYESPPSSYKKGRWAPSWFSKLVDPKLQDYRLNFPIGSILITPDPSRSILDSWDELRTFGWLALIFYLLLNTLVFWLLGRWLRPMAGIVDGLSRIREGNFSVRLSTFKIPELNLISRTFNSVAQALQESRGQQQRLALIAEQSSDAIVIHDLGGKISFWNDAACRIFGYTNEEIFGKSAELITPEDLKSQIEKNLNRIISRERIENLETKRITKKGEILDVSLSAAPLVDPVTNDVIGEICNIRDVTELKAMEKTERELGENKRLTQRVHTRLEEERRVIARELHDELGQGITAIKTIGTAVVNREGTSAETKRNVSTIVSVASTIYDGVHGIIRRLRPSSLDHLGLRETLKDVLSNWSKRNPNIACEINLTDNIDGFEEELNITVYRVVQECLTNIVKHSKANKVEVSVSVEKVEKAQKSLSVLVSDNGIGLKGWNERETNRLGLVGMRERVQALGGIFKISDRAVGGVVVRAKIPLIFINKLEGIKSDEV